MAKFCTKCGSALIDGKCPKCEPEVKIVTEEITEHAEEKENNIVQENTSETESSKVEMEKEQSLESNSDQTETVTEKKVVRKVVRKKVIRKPMNPWEMFLTILKAPVTSMERVVNDVYFVNGLIFGLLESVLNAIFICVLMHSLASMVYNSISSLGNSMMGGYSGGYSMGSSYSNYVNIPYFEIFMKTLILILILRFIFLLINWGLNVGMGKAHISFKAAFPALSSYLVGSIMVLMIAIILCFLSPIAGCIVYGLGSILAMIMYVTSMTGIKGIKKNACVWIAFLTLILTALASILISSVIAANYISQLTQMLSLF
ncbi:MAG: hypothetical protein Q4D45_10560 [Lachnospiraceae bacterium]|nr:hypothetical protein [Lachnospiraceae bacterium]